MHNTRKWIVGILCLSMLSGCASRVLEVSREGIERANERARVETQIRRPLRKK